VVLVTASHVIVICVQCVLFLFRMDPRYGWYQPEQQGPALAVWDRIWKSHVRLYLFYCTHTRIQYFATLILAKILWVGDHNIIPNPLVSVCLTSITVGGRS